MEETTTTVSVNELEKLINAINQQRLPVRIRFRIRGELWYPNFLDVVKVQQRNEIIFYDGKRNNNVVLSDLCSVIQFELDGDIYSFEPHYHYQVSEDILGINDNDYT